MTQWLLGLKRIIEDSINVIVATKKVTALKLLKPAWYKSVDFLFLIESYQITSEINIIPNDPVLAQK